MLGATMLAAPCAIVAGAAADVGSSRRSSSGGSKSAVRPAVARRVRVGRPAAGAR
eukprot:CAMPEP_0197611942 /NCGR_PEP_ID=MMETSP1326-20131121/56342_1 /TAXON_ID=1155430 /ORGANISM="Genus nov. species nov., Strain RCC2288" /LENGTH=54 /DNA_ID=CAMNT_0043180647 /DNA_START=325 /DNA_END=485 /DNA_ORIENTATION=+